MIGIILTILSVVGGMFVFFMFMAILMLTNEMSKKIDDIYVMVRFLTDIDDSPTEDTEDGEDNDS